MQPGLTLPFPGLRVRLGLPGLELLAHKALPALIRLFPALLARVVPPALRELGLRAHRGLRALMGLPGQRGRRGSG